MRKKIIVTNESALREKYGDIGIIIFRASIDSMIGADMAKSYTSFMVAVDDDEQMGRYGCDAVTDVANEEQNKNAVDAIFQKYLGTELLLLGGPDVIPFQMLENPCANGTPIPSDLPYACDEGYSKDIKSFLTPSRCVTRLPDTLGKPAENEESIHIAQFSRCISEAARRDGYPLPVDDPPFVVCAEDLYRLKQPLVQALFGYNTTAITCPPHDDKWSNEQYFRQIHYFALYGASDQHAWFSDAALTKKAYWFLDADAHFRKDPLLLAQTSYSALPRVPVPVSGKNDTELPKIWSIADTYLQNGACAFLGSTGLVSHLANDPSDLLLTTFLQQIQKGANLGGALLEARKAVAKQQSTVSADTLHTLASYVVYGDVPYILYPQTRKLERSL